MKQQTNQKTVHRMRRLIATTTLMAFSFTLTPISARAQKQNAASQSAYSGATGAAAAFNPFADLPETLDHPIALTTDLKLNGQDVHIEFAWQTLADFREADVDRIAHQVKSDDPNYGAEVVFIEKANEGREPQQIRGLISKIKSWFLGRQVDPVEVKVKKSWREKLNRIKQFPGTTPDNVTMGVITTTISTLTTAYVVFSDAGISWWQAALATSLAAGVGIFARVFRDRYEQFMMYSWWKDAPQWADDAYPGDVIPGLLDRSNLEKTKRRNIFWFAVRFLERVVTQGSVRLKDSAGMKLTLFSVGTFEQLIGIMLTYGVADAIVANNRDHVFKDDQALRSAFSTILIGITTPLLIMQALGVHVLPPFFSVGAFQFTDIVTGNLIVHAAFWSMLKYWPRSAFKMTERFNNWVQKVTHARVWAWSHFKQGCSDALREWRQIFSPPPTAGPPPPPDDGDGGSGDGIDHRSDGGGISMYFPGSEQWLAQGA